MLPSCFSTATYERSTMPREEDRTELSAIIQQNLMFLADEPSKLRSTVALLRFWFSTYLIVRARRSNNRIDKLLISQFGHLNIAQLLLLLCCHGLLLL